MVPPLCEIKEFIGYGDCPECGAFAVARYAVKLADYEGVLCFYCYDKKAEGIIAAQFKKDCKSLLNFLGRKENEMKYNEATIQQQEAWKSTFCTKHTCSHADVCRSESDEIVMRCFEEHQIEYPEEFKEAIEIFTIK